MYAGLSPVFKFLVCVWSPILQTLLVIAIKLVYVMHFFGPFDVHILHENVSSV